MMEGVNQMILTPHINRDFDKMLHRITEGNSAKELTSPELANRLNETAQLVFDRFPFTVETYNEVSKEIVEISHTTGDWAHDGTTIEKAVTVFIKLMKTCAEGFGFEPPEEVEINDYHGIIEWSKSIDALGNLSFGNSPLRSIQEGSSTDECF